LNTKSIYHHKSNQDYEKAKGIGRGRGKEKEHKKRDRKSIPEHIPQLRPLRSSGGSQDWWEPHREKTLQ
jgi:hypothetical protein